MRGAIGVSAWMDARLMQFYSDVIQTAESVIGHPAVSLPDTELDMVKLEACISMLEALKSAVNYADEARGLSRSDDPLDKSYLREVLPSYASEQVKVAMNLNAIKAQVKEILV